MLKSPPSIVEETDQAKLREVARRYDLDLIVLFGSYARGRERPDSDVDLAVHTTRRDYGKRDREAEVTWEMELFDDLAGAVPAPEGIDMVVLNRADSTLLFQVANYGLTLHESGPDQFHLFRSLASRRYYDDAKYRRWGREYLRRRLRDG